MRGGMIPLSLLLDKKGINIMTTECERATKMRAETDECWDNFAALPSIAVKLAEISLRAVSSSNPHVVNMIIGLLGMEITTRKAEALAKKLQSQEQQEG